MAKYLDLSGVQVLWNKIKATFVAKDGNKVLSSNDFTNEEKSKLAGIATGANKYTHPTTSGNKHIPTGGSSGQILKWSADGTAVWGTDKDTTYSPATHSANGLMTSEDKKKLDGVASGAQVNVIEKINVNGSALTPSSKAVSITVPTKVSQLTNDSDFQTASEVSSAITSAVSGVTGFKYSVVESLPQTGVAGTIYLKLNSGSGQNIYDEFIWVNNKYEQLGTKQIDLSGYAKKTELPKKTSQLANDSGFLTSIPSNYVTDSELSGKGYQTASQVTSLINSNVVAITEEELDEICI